MWDSQGVKVRVGDKVRLVEMPGNVTIFDYKLTVGLVYKVISLHDGRIETTTDVEGESAFYNPCRVEKINL